jgi:hypothetical protein
MAAAHTHPRRWLLPPPLSRPSRTCTRTRARSTHPGPWNKSRPCGVTTSPEPKHRSLPPWAHPARTLATARTRLESAQIATLSTFRTRLALAEARRRPCAQPGASRVPEQTCSWPQAPCARTPRHTPCSGLEALLGDPGTRQPSSPCRRTHRAHASSKRKPWGR